jgi:hypothetical protein
MVVESHTPPQVELSPRALEQNAVERPAPPRDRTTTDPEALNVTVWLGHDPVIQLREWTTGTVHALPEPDVAEWTIGSEPSAALRIVDPSGLVSRKHARLVRERSWWKIEDLRSKNGIRQDRKHSATFLLVPGVEIGIGGVTLVAENQSLIRLRRYLARVLGWDAESQPAVEVGIQAMRLAGNQRRPLVISGTDDLVAVARQIHLRTTVPGAPFVVCGERREPDVAVHVTAIDADPTAAFALADGGTVCVRAAQLPFEFDRLLSAAQQPGVRTRTQLIICATKTPDWWRVSDPLVVPTLEHRTDADLQRIVAEYASDAIRELDASPGSFSEADRDWVVQHEAGSFADIEIATRRIVACNDAGNPHRAAARLGLSHVALGKWLKHRGLGKWLKR